MQEFFSECYSCVEKDQKETAAVSGDEPPGRISKELALGDLVLARAPPSIKRVGPWRYQSATLPGTFRVSKVIGRNTFEVEAITEPGVRPSFTQPVHGERLVKLDMPELELEPRQPRKLEIHDNNQDVWNRFKIERYAIDGRVFVRSENDPHNFEWLDLSKKRYRWVL